MESSQTRGQTCVPCVSRQIPNHRTTKEVHRDFKSRNNRTGWFRVCVSKWELRERKPWRKIMKILYWAPEWEGRVFGRPGSCWVLWDPLRGCWPPGGCVHWQGFPSGSDGKESTCQCKRLGSSPGSGRSPGGGHGNPLQYSCPRNPMDRGVGGLQPMGSQRVEHDWATNTHRDLHVAKQRGVATLLY